MILTSYNEIIDQLQWHSHEWHSHEATVEKLIEEKEDELGIKIKEMTRMCKENEELKKRVNML